MPSSGLSGYWACMQCTYIQTYIHTDKTVIQTDRQNNHTHIIKNDKFLKQSTKLLSSPVCSFGLLLGVCLLQQTVSSCFWNPHLPALFWPSDICSHLWSGITYPIFNPQPSLRAGKCPHSTCIALFTPVPTALISVPGLAVSLL